MRFFRDVLVFHLLSLLYPIILLCLALISSQQGIVYGIMHLHILN